MIYLLFYTALISFFSSSVVAMLQPYKASSSYLELLAPGKFPANITQKVQEFVSNGNTLELALKNYKWLSLCGITNDRTAQLAQFYAMYPETVLCACKAKRGCNELPRYSEEGNVEVVRLLVDGGEDISFCDKSNIQKRLSDEKDPALAPKLQDIYKAAYGSLPSESGCSLEFLKKIINPDFYELLIGHLETTYIKAHKNQKFPTDSMIWPFRI